MLEGDPLSWFETLYSEARAGQGSIPWAGMKPNPHMVRWVEDSDRHWEGKSALVIGCGLGDDAEYLSALGMKVTAFDLSDTAIAWCKERFPGSETDYRTANLLQAPEEWIGAYDLVFESYTLQSLPYPERCRAIEAISSFVSDQGTLLLICMGRDADDPEGDIPWPLTREELRSFESFRLRISTLDDFINSGPPPVRRFRVECNKT